MTTTATPIKTEKTNISPDENHKGIENHKKIAVNLESAAKLHIEAARQHGLGEHEKAAQSTIKAQGFIILAIEAHREDVKQHALNN